MRTRYSLTIPPVSSPEIPPSDGSSPFLDLPDDIKRDVFFRLPLKAALALGQTNKSTLCFFREQAVALNLAKHLLTFVAQGQEAGARKILEEHPDLLFKNSQVTDCSGRHFSYISPFQYALWVGDADMLKMMQSAIEALPKGKEQALSQMKELETKGVSYDYTDAGGIEKQEKASRCYNNNLLKNAYQTYLANCKHWVETGDWIALRNCWFEKIGGAQRMLPAWQRQAFCQSYPFVPLPTDEQFGQPLERTFQLLDSSGHFPRAMRLKFMPLVPELRETWGWRVNRSRELAVTAQLDWEMYDRVCEVRAQQVEEFKYSLGERPQSKPA
ncbi:MAG: F-box protein [Gammaproteobacteria bacterium]|nr:F-box protein [Gammaproteobacteria bacterium]